MQNETRHMEVAGLVFSAIAFVNEAIKTGTTLARIFRDCDEAGKRIHDVTVRLDAQKYTLVLWRRAWEAKASPKKPAGGPWRMATVSCWGKGGYLKVTRPLAQLNCTLARPSER
jgi:hypothetical protein